MGFINLFSSLSAVWPKGVWEYFIRVFYEGIGNYAWAIIVLTLVLKIVLSPLDYLQKASTAKTSRVQALIAPEMAKLQKVYGNNKQVMNQKQMELYKKHNYNVTGSCVVMLLNLVITLVVFFTFFASMRNIAKFKNNDQYDQLQQEYFITQGISAESYAEMTVEQKLNTINSYTDEQKALSNEAVKVKYNDIKDSWLWIKNIWKADAQTRVISSFNEYVSASGVKFEAIKNADGEEIKSAEAVKEEAKNLYESIMNPLNDSIKGKNGYYILVIIVVLVTLLSQFVMKKVMTPPKSPDGKTAPKMPGTGLWMTLFMVVIMGMFAFTSNSAFSLYMIINQLVTTAITPLVGLIIKAQNKKFEQKQKEKIQVSYRR